MGTPLSDATILVAEDDVVSLEIVSRMLPRLPVAKILKARDGVEALEQINRVDGKVDAAVLDFCMPRMHGLHVLRKIRAGASAADAGLACVMLTGHDDSRLHKIAMALGANAFLQKPATFDRLGTVLASVIAERTPTATPDVYLRIDVEGSVDAILERMADTQGEGDAIDSSAS